MGWSAFAPDWLTPRGGSVVGTGPRGQSSCHEAASVQPEPFEMCEPFHDFNLGIAGSGYKARRAVQIRSDSTSPSPQKRLTTASVMATQSAPAKGKAPARADFTSGASDC